MYLQGFQVDSSKNISESTVTTSYEVSYSDVTTRIDATGGIPSRRDIVGIRALFSANCETGATSINGPFSFHPDGVLDSFDPDKKPTPEQITAGDATVTLSDTDGNLFRTGVGDTYTSHCYRYFYGDLSTDRTPFEFGPYSVSTMDSPQITPASSSTESDKLSGVGLQFGYRWEKWRASFTHYTGTGGDNELTNSLVIADYFFQEKFFVGAGLASMQLTNSSAEGDSLSASATSPVLQVGYAAKLTKNLQLSIGLLQYSSGLSLSSTTPTTTTPTITPFGSVTQTATNEGDSATIGSRALVVPGGEAFLSYDVPSGGNDNRVEVTQVGTRTVNIQKTVTPVGGETTIEAELKAPTVISISFHLSF